jgi:hypothetical protein
MESRASTRLGENVKLLTFVSIFFLPLSFCMVSIELSLKISPWKTNGEYQSVWSINDTLFSLSALGITATVIALATYIIVFNINNLSRGLAKLYNFCETNIVTQMEKEREIKVENDKNEWPERAERFRKAEAMNRDEHVVPSKWRLVQYAFSRPKAAFLAVWMALSRGSQEKIMEKKRGGAPQSRGTGKNTESNGFLGRWRSRRTKKAGEIP